MLHEVLLALSGHPSPLFGTTATNGEGLDSERPLTIDFPLLSPSEAALLQSIGRLAELHRRLRTHIEAIAAGNQSTVCRAVATSIRQVHLARFQQRIIDVESRIMTKDASIVGAYDIVPLAGVVGEFNDWHRRMDWYWKLATFMQPTDGPDSSAGVRCTGAALVDRLRVESQTGFPNIEVAATELSRVAETAWLRQVSVWLLYGRLPTFGDEDFFVQSHTDGDQRMFISDRNLLPKFVSPQTASSMVFIGRSLHQVRLYGRSANKHAVLSHAMNDAAVTSSHLDHLSSLALPLLPAQLSRAISAIRLSLSRNILHHLLPLEDTLQLLECLRQYFLLGRGEFALALITEADNRLHIRQQGAGRLLQGDSATSLRSIGIKDAEVSQALAQTWKSLATVEDDTEEDGVIDFARQHIALTLTTSSSSRPPTSDSVNGAGPQMSTIAFNDLLFPAATNLTLRIRSPMDLFISSKEMTTYTLVNGYLLALRRAHLRLSDLWRLTSARRVYPEPCLGSDTEKSGNLRANRERLLERSSAMRRVWATCSAALFLLSETVAYFEGEVIKGSWDHFHDWVVTTPNYTTGELSGAVKTLTSEMESLRASTGSSKTPRDHPASGEEDNQGNAQHDPESLASAHRSFLASLTYALLLTDVPYTRDLRTLLGDVDSLIAFFKRLQDVQQRRDVEQDAGVGPGIIDYAEEESVVSLELDRSRKRVDSDLKSVVNRLRQLDHERVGSSKCLSAIAPGVGDFVPWKGGGVDRLLMKLDFGRTNDEETLVSSR